VRYELGHKRGCQAAQRQRKLTAIIVQAQTRIKNGTIDDVFNENDSFDRRAGFPDPTMP
jgi:hypothetical protein